MRCPKCGSENIQTLAVTNSHSRTKTKGFGSCKACIGFLIFSLPGVLCGLCGMGKGKSSSHTSTKLVKVCNNCGKRFR